MIHGMVDRPLVFTVDEIKRLPSVTRVHFLECAGNSSPRHIKQNKPVVTLGRLLLARGQSRDCTGRQVVANGQAWS